MSAAFSQDNESKESAPTELGRNEKPRQGGWVNRWTAMLSVATAPFAPARVNGSTEQVGWAKRCTVVAGLIAALVGIPPGIVKLQEYLEILAQPHKMEVLTGELTIAYVPEHEQVELIIDFKAKENGHRDNQILTVKAGVESPSQPLALEALEADIYFLEGEFRVEKPVIAAGAGPREMRCCLVSHLSDRTRGVFQTAGLRRLVVVLKGKDKSYPLTFCFELDDHAIHGLFHSELRLVRYLTSDQLIKDQLYSAEIAHGGSYEYQD